MLEFLWKAFVTVLWASPELLTVVLILVALARRGASSAADVAEDLGDDLSDFD